MWVGLSIFASICFTICNSFIVELSLAVGPYSMFYFASGAVFASMIFNLIEAYRNKQEVGIFWNNQNLIVYGKLRWRNVFGFICFCGLYFIVQNGVLLTIYFAVAADLNAGVITTIWSVTPFFCAFADYLLFNERLRIHHFIGISCIVLCTLLLSLIKVIDPEIVLEAITLDSAPSLIPTYIPVLMGIFVPVVFTIWGMTIKHLTQERIGFKPSNLGFNSCLVVNLIVLVVVLPYWSDGLGHFNQRLFWIGFVGSIFDTIGKVSANASLSYGPAGPCAALQCLSGMYLVAV